MGISKVFTVPAGTVLKLGKAVANAGGRLGGHIVSKLTKAETPATNTTKATGHSHGGIGVDSKSSKEPSYNFENNVDTKYFFLNELRAGLEDREALEFGFSAVTEKLTSEQEFRHRENDLRHPSTAPTPTQVGKIIGDDIARCAESGETSEYAFRLDTAAPKKRTKDNPDRLCGTEQLRRCLRTVHGVGRKDARTKNIARSPKNSPLHKMLQGETIYMWREKSETKYSTAKPNRDGVLKLDGREVVQAQKDVQTWTNGLTDKEVKDILTLKADHMVDVPSNFEDHWAYRRHLAVKAEKMVMRSTTFMTHKPTGELLDEPREHIVYHACYPELRNGTESERYYATGPSGNAKIRVGMRDKLRDTYKSIILQQLKVASANGEDIDLQAPNAFLQGLEGTEQQVAKMLFRHAVYEAAREAKADPDVYGGLKAIYIHDAADGIPDDLKDMVINNGGDAFAPDRIGQERGGRRVAVCIMSDGIGPVGNAALGDRAWQAMEENTARLCSGTLEATGPAFNENCRQNVLDLAQAQAAA